MLFKKGFETQLTLKNELKLKQLKHFDKPKDVSLSLLKQALLAKKRIGCLDRKSVV